MPRVLQAYEPPDGGVAENAMQLALRLSEHGFEAAVAGPLESLPYARLEAAGVPVHRIPFERGYSRPWREPAALRALTRLIRAGGFDLVHCHSAKAGALGRLAARRAGVPSVYSPHCFGFVGDVGAPRRAAVALAERRLARHTAAIVCACEAERRRGLERQIAPPERLRRVYYGSEPCDTEVEVDPALRALRGEGLLVGAVTVLREQKRVDLLLDAAPGVFARVPEARIAVVGDGPLRDQLHAHAARLGLDRDERFAFLPFRAPPARHLRALDVYALPSAWEAMPIAVLEALACGVPQVVTDVEGTGEAVAAGETGLLIGPRDAAALGDAIVELLRDPARRERMAAASRARHAARFAVERMVAETATVYRDALAAAGG
jgi:glycosyltransferase involved in cell wall biosynthesis